MNPAISSVEGAGAPPVDLPWSEFECAIVESPAAIEFLDFNQPGAAAKAADFPAGVAFGPDSELRWLTRRNGLHFVYISDTGKSLSGAQPRQLRPSDDAGFDRVFLWGMRNNRGDDFFETRIPRRLRYKSPAGVADRERLTVRLKHFVLSVPQTFVGLDAADPDAAEARIDEVSIFRLVQIEPELQHNE